MLQRLPTLFLGCLLLSSAALPLQSIATSSPVPIIDPSFNSSDPKAIAQQVLKDAIAKEKLDRTAKVVRIERTGRELWMYNPVPYWRITIADQRQTLVYFTNREGRFRVLMQRNGKPTHSEGEPAQEIAPPDMTSEAFRKAKEWDYPAQEFSETLSEKVNWASGCENVSAPFPCDPVLRQGWKITVPFQQARWVFRGENAESLQLIERSNPTVERRLSSQARTEIRKIAAQHSQLLATAVLITKVEPQTFSDSCLGLGSLAETCLRQTIQGYRVTVMGNPKEQTIYRISADGLNFRTEAGAGLPSRTDLLPTAIARKVLNAAQLDLKRSRSNLRISQVEPTYECFRNPTAPPNEPCFPSQRLSGWRVTVTNYQRLLTYTVNTSGTILSKK